jgi:prepilin-type N-terminal cleavage/methylation domain-containing protein
MPLKRLPRAVDRTRVRAPRRSAGQAGFTLIEVMMASLVLAVGVLGSFTLLDTANKTISSNNGRTGATNLAREVTEYARGTDYDLLTPAQVETTLRARARIAGTGAAGSWKVVRRGVTYAITPTVCTFDDPKDGLAATAPPNACTPAAAAIALTPVEANPDDFRRLSVKLQWTDRQGTHKVTQTALVVNPSGGLGPRIKTFTEPAGQITGSQVQWVAPTNPVLTDPAATIRWHVDDGVSSGEVTGASATTWTLTWSLGALGTSPFVYDGTYLVSAQAFDLSGFPGEARAVSVSVNRRVPYAPASFAGGRNVQHGGVVDVDWTRSPERDVVGYRIWRVQAAGLVRTEICDDSGLTYTTKTSCTDTNPESSALPVGTPNYEVAAVDYVDLKNRTGLRTSPADTASLVLATISTKPGSPVVAVPTIVDGSPRLTWTVPAVGAGQRPIRFYRIYRDGGTSVADRYDVTVDTSFTWTDPAPGSTTSHKYWVTAVDTSSNESDPSIPVQSP